MAEQYLLKDKVAIITGGAAGIGYAIAGEFAKEGDLALPENVVLLSGHSCEVMGSCEKEMELSL